MECRVYMSEKHLIIQDADKVSIKIAGLVIGMARHGLATAVRKASQLTNVK
tara:strand:- start:9897 stop:10049 length:153 start_codon:yes stop_codon:yes gene_type:complete